jgi:hypothetical protein
MPDNAIHVCFTASLLFLFPNRSAMLLGPFECARHSLLSRARVDQYVSWLDWMSEG